jgi:hypothetical protein
MEKKANAGKSKKGERINKRGKKKKEDLNLLVYRAV